MAEPKGISEAQRCSCVYAPSLLHTRDGVRHAPSLPPEMEKARDVYLEIVYRRFVTAFKKDSVRIHFFLKNRKWTGNAIISEGTQISDGRER